VHFMKSRKLPIAPLKSLSVEIFLNCLKIQLYQPQNKKIEDKNLISRSLRLRWVNADLSFSEVTPLKKR